MKQTLFGLCLAVLLLGTAIGCTEKTEQPSLPTETAQPCVRLSTGEVPVTETELVLPATASDFEVLEQLPSLRSVDFSGSTFYEEILAYREAHPEVAVRYTVTVGEQTVSSEETELVLPRWDASVSSVLPYLEQVERLVVKEPLSCAEAKEVLALSERIAVEYSVSVAGMTVSSTETETDWSALDPSHAAELFEALTVLPKLTNIRLENEAWTLEQVGELQSAREDVVVDHPITAFGITFSTAVETLVLNEIRMKDKLDELRALVPYLKNCRQIDMEGCRVSNETMAELREELAPDIKVVWRIRCDRYECRTDSVMIKFSTGKPMLTDDDVKALRYCNEVRYLDLGHNKLHRMEFLEFMPELEVCIIAVCSVVDITGIEHCTKLEYCELLSGMIKDISPLAACTELKHLNLSYNYIKDITPLYGLTKLERLWISRNQIPSEQVEAMQAIVPDCIINTTSMNPTGEGWRDHPRYEQLRAQFYYDYSGIKSYTTPPDVPPIKEEEP